MRKLIEENGGAIVATAAAAFAIGYSVVTCDINSYVSGFASGAAAIVAFALWFD